MIPERVKPVNSYVEYCYEKWRFNFNPNDSSRSESLFLSFTNPVIIRWKIASKIFVIRWAQMRVQHWLIWIVIGSSWPEKVTSPQPWKWLKTGSNGDIHNSKAWNVLALFVSSSLLFRLWAWCDPNYHCTGHEYFVTWRSMGSTLVPQIPRACFARWRHGRWRPICVVI